MEQLLKWKSISAIWLIAMCFYSANAKADMQGKKKNKVAQQQTVKEDYGNTVTLVTTGSGSTEDEATRNALRNALEQAYGTFVSANTTVVNDELVSDAITSVSSGNVLGYEQISCISTSQGGFSVSVKATVSIGNLVSFATSRGMTAELAGNTFLMNRNLAKLNKENERTALTNLVDQLYIIIGKGMYDYSVEVSQPRTNSAITRTASYAIDIKVNAKPNANYDLFWETIDQTLSSLSMSQTESANYKSLEMKTYEYSYGPSWDRFKIDTKTNLVGTKSRYILRNNIGKVVFERVSSDEKTEVFLLDMIEAFEKMGKFCYEIYDNIGNTVTPTVYSRDKISEDHRIKYGIDGFMIKGNYFTIVLLESSTVNHRLSRTYESGEKGIVGNDFVMQYDESELSKLRNISVRPHTIIAVSK